MMIILIGSVLGGSQIGKEFFPNVPSDYIVITKAYPGAGPIEVEEQIVVPIEEAVHNIEGVSGIDSVARQGFGRVGLEVQPGYDRDTFFNNVNTRINGISTFPVDSEKVNVTFQDKRPIVMRLAIHGDIDKQILKKFAQQIRDDLATLSNVENAELLGESRPEIEIVLSELNMRRYGISFEQVTQAIRRSSLNLAAGSIEGDRGTIQLQARAQSYSEEDFREIVISSPPDGAIVRIRDVALVRETEEQKNFLMRFNNENAVMIDVMVGGNKPSLSNQLFAPVRRSGSHYGSC